MNSNTRVSFIVLYFFALLFIFVRIYMSRVYICKICHSESKQTFTMNHPQVNISDGWLTVCFHYGFIHWIRQQKSHSLITSQLLALISWSFCFAYSLCALTPSHKCHIFDRQLPFNNTHTHTDESCNLHRFLLDRASFRLFLVINYSNINMKIAFLHLPFRYFIVGLIFVGFVVCTRSIRSGYEHDHCFIDCCGGGELVRKMHFDY